MRMTGGCNDEPNEKMKRGEPRYNEQNEGIMVCDGVGVYVCVCCRCVYLCMCVCACLVTRLYSGTHTHSLVIFITSLFLSFF